MTPENEWAQNMSRELDEKKGTQFKSMSLPKSVFCINKQKYQATYTENWNIIIAFIFVQTWITYLWFCQTYQLFKYCWENRNQIWNHSSPKNIPRESFIIKHEYWNTENSNRYIHLLHCIVWLWNMDTNQRRFTEALKMWCFYRM